MSTEHKMRLAQTMIKKKDTAGSVKCNNNIDYFTVGQEKLAHRERSANIPK